MAAGPWIAELARYARRDRRVGIEHVAACGAHPAHFFLGLLRRCHAALEFSDETRFGLVVQFVAPSAGEVVHQPLDLRAVAIVQKPQQALDVRRLADIHRRRIRYREFFAWVVDARLDETRKNVVHVRSADELADFRAQHLRIVCREDIAEIARRDYHIEFAQARGGEHVVANLRHETAGVDRVCARKIDVVF